ncbi:hypothetical protein GX586_16040 [bacterium]|nr:hypothetical protein [bacterium]
MATRGLQIDVGVGAAFDRNAAQASISLDDAIRQMQRQGRTREQVQQALQSAFDAGQGPFAQFKAGIKKSLTGLTSQRVSIETARQLSGGDSSVMGVWMTTGGSNVCPGCAKLHGQQMSEAEFERRHGTHECGVNCYCFWMPGETAETGAFTMREVMQEHPEWFHTSSGDVPPGVAAEQTIAERQATHLAAAIEVATVVSRSGRVLAEVSGAEDRVQVPDPKEPGAVLTHNHVIGSPPSGDDVAALMQMPYAEVRNTGWEDAGKGARKPVKYRIAKGSVDLHPEMQHLERLARQLGVSPDVIKGDRLARVLDQFYAAEVARVGPRPSLQQRKTAKHAAWLKLSREYGVLYAKDDIQNR